MQKDRFVQILEGKFDNRKNEKEYAGVKALMEDDWDA
jgi:hypothetical protein